MVENNNIRREEDETTMKASRRCRMIPVTRRDDFLWTATSKKIVKVEKEGKMKQKHRVNEIFNFFLNIFIRINYSSFLLFQVKYKMNKNSWITPGIITSCKRKENYIRN